MSSPTPPIRRTASGGPPLPVVAGAFTVLFVVGLAASALVGGGSLPSPFDDAATIQTYFAGEPTAVLIGAVFQFGAAVPLAVFAAAVHARLHHLGIRVAAASIALGGGLLAAAFAMLSALVQWTLSRPSTVSEPALVRALHDLAFMTGGPAHVAAQGLLLAGIAVPALIVRLLPRWLAIAGLVLAVIAELSILTLLLPGFAVTLPLARFAGMAWLITAGALLPATRKARTESADSVSTTPLESAAGS